MKLRKVLVGTAIVASFTMLNNSHIMANTAIVNTETLNLRKEASTSSIVLEQLDVGEKIDVIEENGGWLKVKARGITGYVSKDYVKMSNENSQTTNNTKTNEVTNTTGTTTTANNTEKTNTENTNTATNTIATNEVATNTTTSNTTDENKTPTTSKIRSGVASSSAEISILPLINANKIGKIEKNASVNVFDEVNGWYYIQTETTNGWVRKNTINVEETTSAQTENEKTNTENTISVYTNQNTEKENTIETSANVENEIEETPIKERTMYVNYSSIYIRKGPGTNYEIVDSLIYNNDVIVTAESGDWYKVRVGNIEGYIAKRLLSNSVQPTSRSAEEMSLPQMMNAEAQTTENKIEQEANLSKGEQIVNYAKEYLGCKYVYGGSGPSTFDCSGFTMYVYKHFGVNLSHSATAQSKNGSYVAKNDLQPGDLVFFKDYETMEGIGHCGIYIGNGEFIHASSGTGYCVKISTLLTGSYEKRYETARRIF